MLLNLISNAIACTMRGGLRGGGLIGDGARYEVCGEVHWEAWKDASQKKNTKVVSVKHEGISMSLSAHHFLTATSSWYTQYRSTLREHY